MPAPSPAQIVSSHVTSEGLLVYSRAEDGRLEVWLRPWAGAPEQMIRPTGARTSAAPLQRAC